MKLKILKKIFSGHKKRAAIADSSLVIIWSYKVNAAPISHSMDALAANIKLKAPAFEISKIRGVLFSRISRRSAFSPEKAKSLLILLAGSRKQIFVAKQREPALF